MYILKASHNAAHGIRTHSNGQLKSLLKLSLEENITLNDKDIPVSDGPLTLLNANHISYLLCYYSKLKEESYDDLMGDMH